MVLVPGDAGLLAAPLALAGSASRGLQAEKKDIQRKIPIPLPHEFKPSGLGFPSPADILGEIDSRVREVVSYPLRILESTVPSPPQAVRTLEGKRPFETVRQHVMSIPTPFDIFKALPPGRDIITPREAMADAQRAMEDGHLLMSDQHENFKENVPVFVENTKQMQADMTAIRHHSTDFMKAMSKSIVKMSGAVAKLAEDFADGGLLGVIF